jgi:transcriptional regulator with XRE-family HTH domain
MKKPQNLPVGGNVPIWTLGDRLRKARDWAGITRDELADELGVHARTISSYELDQTKPKKAFLRQWALHTGVPYGWLVDGQNFHPDGDNLLHSDRYSPVTRFPAAA